MPSLGKSITLYLMDGTASGRWQAELSNWNGKAYKISRNDLKDCSDIDDLNAPGVYFLFGKDDESEKKFVYVGEADDVLKRLLQPHTFEKDGSYWTEAVAFVTPDGTLEKGRVKYLENRFYMIVSEANRFIVKNGNTPKQSPMPRQVRDLLEGFIINVRLVLPALGYPVFEPQPSSDGNDVSGDEELLYFKRNNGKGGDAVGKITSDGFWILKGSYICPDIASYTSSGIKKARKKYADIIGKDGRLKEDICFGSPSYASTFVCGKNSNGLTEWKNKNGISLKDLDTDNKQQLNQKMSGTRKENPDNQENTDLLHLAGKKASAEGYMLEDGFVVCKGSGFCEKETKSCQGWIKNMRKRLLKEKKIINGIFAEDVTFKSPSAAAACIIGGSANGNILWICSNGKSIKENGLV